jgi:hypothetical protein
MRKGLFLGVVVVASLQGCGGGGGGAAPPAPQLTDLSGIWEGTASTEETTMEFSGVVTGNGESRFIDGFGAQYIITSATGTDGEIRLGLTAMSRPGLEFMDGSTRTTGTFTGTVVERSTVEGSYTLASGETGVVSVVYNPIYERDSSLAKLTGPWDETLGVQVFDPDGTFFEQDGFGCVYQGRASILNPDYNVYAMTMTISLCDEADGDYSGLGLLADFEATEDVFIVLMNSENSVVNTSMVRL